jgi:hypothetical protein
MCHRIGNATPFIASQESNVVGQIANLPRFRQVGNLPHDIRNLIANGRRACSLCPAYHAANKFAG